MNDNDQLPWLDARVFLVITGDAAYTELVWVASERLPCNSWVITLRLQQNNMGSEMAEKWTPDSWRTKPVVQVPDYPNLGASMPS